MKQLFIFIITILISLSSIAQNQQIRKVKWYTLKEALELTKENPKKIFIDFYTDWCGWCKRMDATTFTDQQVAIYLNRYFYPVKFDAEGYDTLSYKDTVYVNRGTGKKSTHDLAVKLLNRRLTYPSVMFMDEKSDPITVVPGFREANEFLAILVYMNEDVFKTSIQFPDFHKYFKKTYPEGQAYSMARSIVKWLTLEEALEKNKTNPKKIFLEFNVNWSVGSTMMMMSTYNNPIIGNYLNEKFYPVRIDATTRDTLTFGQKYINPGKAPSFHQLPYAMLQGKMKFPAILYLDENNKLINVVQTYLTPEALEPMLKYFGENKYKEKAWKDYLKNFESKLKKETEDDISN